jgi:hypothetical protein
MRFLQDAGFIHMFSNSYNYNKYSIRMCFYMKDNIKNDDNCIRRGNFFENKKDLGNNDITLLHT